MAARVPLRLLLAAACALAIAACGSGSSTTTRTVTATLTTTTTVASSPPSSSSSSTAAVSPHARAAGAGGSGCAAGEVSVSAGPSSAGLGHVGTTLLFENVGSRTCTLTGYPGVALVAAGGGQRQARRTPNGYLGGLSSQATAAPVVRIAPRQTASALLEGDASTSAGGPCPGYVAVLVTPPNQTVTRRLVKTMSICAAQIHPVVAGTSGRQQ